LGEHIDYFHVFLAGVVLGLLEESAEEVDSMSKDGRVDNGLGFLVQLANRR
jgi:hypothetical protein